MPDPEASQSTDDDLGLTSPALPRSPRSRVGRRKPRPGPVGTQEGIQPEPVESEPASTLQDPQESDPDLAEDVEDTVANITVQDQTADDYIDPEIKLPMILVRNKPLMVQYASHLGRTRQEAQSRREKLTLTPKVMRLYRAYRRWCEQHGKRFWTERGFAAALVCHQRGIPVIDPDEEPAQDVLDNLERRI